MIEIYTDGGFRAKQKDGAWSYAVILNDKLLKSESGHSKDLNTNNRNELYAVYSGMKDVYDTLKDKEKLVKMTIYSDSAYIVNCFLDSWHVGWRKKGWKNSKKKPVENRDLWEKILDLYEKDDIKVTFVKVKGHSGDKWNDYADELLNETMDSLL